MFEVTKQAARQIRKAAQEGDMEELALRIDAIRSPDGSISYQMGFDEIGVGDTLLNSKGVDIVISTEAKELLNGTILDFVEMEPEDLQFIFLNPNDPQYRPPTE
jgi:iron-sulfur cluster assembly protein